MPTVFGVTNSAAAISLFERPSAASAAMRCSVGVSSPVAAARRPPMRASSAARPLGPDTRSELLEDGERLLERLPRRTLHPGPVFSGAEHEQRAGVLEGHRYSLVLGDRLLQRRERAVEIAPRGREQAAAAGGRGQRGSTIDVGGLLLKDVEQRLGIV